VGVLRSLPETRRMVEQSCVETFTVARARHIELAEDCAAKSMAALDTIAPGLMASLQRDIEAGRPSELDALTGALVRLGAEVGIETPLHAFLYHSLLPQELRARGQLQFPARDRKSLGVHVRGMAHMRCRTMCGTGLRWPRACPRSSGRSSVP